MTPIDTAELERLAAAIPAAPWIATFDHPLNAAAFVVQEGEDRHRSIATLYGVHDAVDLPAEGNPWGPHPIRDATAEAISYLPALIIEVLAHRKAEADLVSALRQTAAILLAEKNRSGGQPFSGIWLMPALGIRATVDETLDTANELLDRYLPTTPEADGGSDDL